MIEAMYLSSIVEIVGGQLNELTLGESLVTGVSIDTRTLKPGDLFIAIKGPRFDGHHYLAQAQVSGAVAALTKYYTSDVTLPQVVVEDSEKALGFWGRPIVIVLMDFLLVLPVPVEKLRLKRC